MHLLVLFVLCAGLFSKCSLADEEIEVKRGDFPFMAFVYYSDKTIVDRTGARLTRGAVLIRPEWLISSSLEDGETSLAFPKETLVARLGAVRIDPRFSVNEDEEEQEREIVQITGPNNYTATEWWLTDITLLKTLFPFNISSVVAPFAINASPTVADKGCFILTYSAPNGNRSEDKLLMKLSVDMLPSTPENCGSNFVKSSMICAANREGPKKHSNFCEGNSGSPLICDGEVVGIQTYINDCEPPHLFQHLKSWDNLITCAVEDKCHEEQCGTICNVINKDPLEFPFHQQPLVEAKVYPEGIVNRSDNAHLSSTSMLRRLLPDTETIPDNDSNKEVNNTETTTSTSSTVVYATEKEIVASETELKSPTVTAFTEEELDRNTPFASLATVFNTETEATHYLYKNEELVSKVEELKNLIEENGSMNKSQTKIEEHKEPDPRAASVNTRCSCCVMFASLTLFYLQFSFIVNSF